MDKCRALEAEITHSEQHAQHLMQAVLKEAFSEQAPSKEYTTEELQELNIAAEEGERYGKD